MTATRLIALLVTLAPAMVFASAAHAVCELELERIDTASWSRSGGYDVFDPIGYADRFTFEVLHPDPDGERCDARISVAPVATPRLAGPGGAALSYELRTDASLPGRPAGITFDLEMQPGERRQLAYFVLLPPGQFTVSGAYENRLKINVLEGIDGVLEDRDDAETPIRATVGSSARISFVGAVGRRQTIDFGELIANKAAPPVFLDVQSTGDYEISLTSEENGRLVQRADGQLWAIPYHTSLDGAAADLGAQTKLSRRFSGPADPAGRRIPLEFRLGTIGDQRAGNYRDHITIEITPTSR